MTEELDQIVADIEALEAFLGPERRWECPWVPNPRQADFLALTDREALYGGAAAGGKTAALLMAAAQYIHVPNYSALILRRTFPELLGSDGPVSQAKRLFEDLLVSGEMWWMKSEMTLHTKWGAQIRFGHIVNDDDVLQYQGQAYQYVGFDELTHFKESMYTYLFSRLRPSGGLTVNVPLRIRGATNPGGIGHDWVGKRFAIREDGSQDAAAAVNQETGERRPFVTARISDNAANIDVNEYRRSLTNLDATTRSQLELGRWIRTGQGLVYRFNRKRNLVPYFDRAAGPWRYVLGIDLGTSQSKPTTALDVLAYHEFHPKVVVVQSEALAGMIPSTIADRIAELREDFDFEQVVVDQGGLGAGYIGEFALRFGEIVTGAQKKDKLGFRSLMNGALEGKKLDDDTHAPPELYVVGWVDGDDVRGPNADLVGELESLVWDERGLDVPKGAADHLSDALLYGWRATAPFAAEDPGELPKPGTAAWHAAEERRLEAALEAEECREEPEWWEGGG